MVCGMRVFGDVVVVWCLLAVVVVDGVHVVLMETSPWMFFVASSSSTIAEILY